MPTLDGCPPNSLLSSAKHNNVNALLLAMHQSYAAFSHQHKIQHPPFELDPSALELWLQFTIEHWNFGYFNHVQEQPITKPSLDTTISEKLISVPNNSHPLCALLPHEWALLASPKKTKLLINALQSALQQELSYQTFLELTDSKPTNRTSFLAAPREHTPKDLHDFLKQQRLTPLKSPNRIGNIHFLAGQWTLRGSQIKGMDSSLSQKTQYYGQLTYLFIFTLLSHTLLYQKHAQHIANHSFLGQLKKLQTANFWLASAIWRSEPFTHYPSSWLHFFIKTAKMQGIACPSAVQSTSQWDHAQAPMSTPLVLWGNTPSQIASSAPWNAYPLSKLNTLHFATPPQSSRNVAPPPELPTSYCFEQVSRHLQGYLESQKTPPLLQNPKDNPILHYWNRADLTEQLMSTFLSFARDSRLAGSSSTSALHLKLTLLESTSHADLAAFFHALPAEQASSFLASWLELPAHVVEQFHSLFETYCIGAKYPITLLPFWGKALNVPLINLSNRIFLKTSDRSLEQQFLKIQQEIKASPFAQQLQSCATAKPPEGTFSNGFAQWKDTLQEATYWRFNHILSHELLNDSTPSSPLQQWATSMDYLHWDFTQRHLQLTKKIQAALPQPLQSASSYYLFANFWHSLRSGTSALLHSLYQSDTFAQQRFEHYLLAFSEHHLSFENTPNGSISWSLLFEESSASDTSSQSSSTHIFFKKRAQQYLKQSFATANSFSMHTHWKYFSNFFYYFLTTENISLSRYLSNPKLSALRDFGLFSPSKANANTQDYYLFFQQNLIPRLLSSQEKLQLQELMKKNKALYVKAKSL